MKVLTVVSIVLELLLLVGGLLQFFAGLLIGDQSVRAAGHMLAVTAAVLMLLRKQTERDEKDG